METDRPLKRWRHGGKPLLIPVQHEPGIQRGFMEGKGAKRAARLMKPKGSRK